MPRHDIFTPIAAVIGALGAQTLGRHSRYSTRTLLSKRFYSCLGRICEHFGANLPGLLLAIYEQLNGPLDNIGATEAPQSECGISSAG